jgi:predicted Zn-ribbon and HTH transcriptional regulator
MLVCRECGYVFEEEEASNWVEEHGEENCGCPRCKGEFEEAARCKICGEWFLDNGIDEVCEECKEQNLTYSNALKVGDKEKQTVEINGFLASVYSISEINDIIQRSYETRLSAIYGLSSFINKTNYLLNSTNYEVSNYLEQNLSELADVVKEK